MRVDATNLSLRHASGVLSLDAVSFSLAEGDFCAVQGASGAGKSTFLGILGGHMVPSSGRIFVDGHLFNAETLGRLRPHIGQVYQDHRLVGQASVLANIAAGTAAKLPLWRALCDVFPKPIRKRAAELLNALGMDEAMLDRPASTLSGGQAQRIGIARALIGKPRLVLADEPVASLDPETARLTLTLLADCARESGATVICALHQPDLAVAFANRRLVLDNGRLVSGRVQGEKGGS
jgi:phosphonate transport system ATP-binding protein